MSHAERYAPLRREWSEYVREQSESGERVIAYCRRKGIDVDRLYRWRRKLREEARKESEEVTDKFVELGVLRQVETSALEVRLGDGMRIAVGPGFDEHTLKRLVSVLV